MTWHGVSKLSSLCLNQLDVLLLFKKESTTDNEDVWRRRNFGRAWAGYGCRKCFDFSCQMHYSSQPIIGTLISSAGSFWKSQRIASSFWSLSQLRVQAYIANDSSVFSARRAVNLSAQSCQSLRDFLCPSWSRAAFRSRSVEPKQVALSLIWWIEIFKFSCQSSRFSQVFANVRSI